MLRPQLDFPLLYSRFNIRARPVQSTQSTVRAYLSYVELVTPAGNQPASVSLSSVEADCSFGPTVCSVNLSYGVLELNSVVSPNVSPPGCRFMRPLPAVALLLTSC